MKPKTIRIIRHGQSEGNVDRSVYDKKPDYALLLTPKGEEEAKEAGRTLVSEGLTVANTFFYVSPLFRTRQTFENIVSAFPDKQSAQWREDPRLREQEWGHLKGMDECRAIDEARDAYGPFYYRIPDGESAADVYDRISDFYSTMYRDFEKETFPENVVIVTHGMSVRLFLMRWFHYSVEEFERLKNPPNCKIITMALQESGKYKLLTEMEEEKPYHNFQREIKLKR